jgi:hypothetical protein
MSGSPERTAWPDHKKGLLFANKKKQKTLLCGAEGLKVSAVGSTVGIAPEGMGNVEDNGHGLDTTKDFAPLLIEKRPLPFSYVPLRPVAVALAGRQGREVIDRGSDDQA